MERNTPPRLRLINPNQLKIPPQPPIKRSNSPYLDENIKKDPIGRSSLTGRVNPSRVKPSQNNQSNSPTSVMDPGAYSPDEHNKDKLIQLIDEQRIAHTSDDDSLPNPPDDNVQKQLFSEEDTSITAKTSLSHRLLSLSESFPPPPSEVVLTDKTMTITQKEARRQKDTHYLSLSEPYSSKSSLVSIKRVSFAGTKPSTRYANIS
ncbi:hypothetical protein HOH87_05735 [bacterium]|jgi:hypothetical protein|nr:hypothetical protein [bacterium]